ncbi:hypothetical protein Ddye_009360 [Dipteronia dyeriana]|uniref:RNase H type-1 domain-containing protein n=1 Tax=Dipteronia dyeriana TaxID=168575 RepID=A0AAE0CMT7_9ROSI|nr:hypothetical protein Ddye_009360 [Dipteronia dyeriana]
MVPPLAGIFRINTDATIQDSNQLIGVGEIVRDSGGQVLASSVQRFSTCFSPHVAEATTILRGLLFAVDSGLLPAVLESDARWVVDLIDSNETAFADLGVVICDIVSLKKQFDVSISFLSRCANKAAHSLSKLALKWMISFGSSPILLAFDSVILDDCLA